MARADDQINIRLDPQDYAVLAAAAFVRGMKSPTELAREWVRAGVDQARPEPAVALALKGRETHVAERTGRLRHLRPTVASDGAGTSDEDT